MHSRNRKFWNLSRKAGEKPLSNEEFAILAGFRVTNPELAAEEQAERDVISFIREHATQPIPSGSFNGTLVRKWRQTRLKSGVAYWSPAILGAGIAGLAVLAILQMLNSPAVPVNISNHEAIRVSNPPLVFPNPDIADGLAPR